MNIDVQVGLGYHNEVELSRAILIYETKNAVYNGPNDAFASVHKVRFGGAAPMLESGELVSLEALHELVKVLSPVSGLELLPPHILAANSENLVWFEPGRERVMFYRCSDPLLTKLSGRSFPQPALLFIAGHQRLRILALSRDERPTPDSRLYAAPYWNTLTGGVCLGSTSLPETLSAKDAGGYSSDFFASTFTHGSSNLLYRNWFGTVGELWQHVEARGRFPTEHLVPPTETLGELFRA